MKRNIIETVLGAVVLFVAVAFFAYASSQTDVGEVSGYEVHADFNDVGGLKEGDNVRMSGVKIGTVESIRLDDYRARVAFSVEDDVKLPVDSAATVASESLMGGNYLSIAPGADDQMIKPGGAISYVQDAQDLQTLLGKFIFSMTGSKKSDDAASPASSAAPNAPAAPAVTPAMPQM
ncbi:MAG: outer membrane lipid asymmetry maintenance protein MlaD [Rhodospirillales bacterium]|nr:outer membrane lipid asymmetry maintenance protein MlaD [Alphaproteobacteria bacterium]MCB9986652.1 outer membrane lipid asymmetry maintenance protein MlaD [Rhodospirillales bacterium]USO06820.1 MAG: outer membrane lipid asymmetry maintenance protein MlaD [Rhodospirillales bacterium]